MSNKLDRLANTPRAPRGGARRPWVGGSDASHFTLKQRLSLADVSAPSLKPPGGVGSGIRWRDPRR